jgi:hypothetical protein
MTLAQPPLIRFEDPFPVVTNPPSGGTHAQVSDPTAVAIIGLYSAAFDRAPDPAGLTAWEAAAANGASLLSVAAGFVGSAEFQASHPNMSPTAFVTELYQTAFHRSPDPAGLDGWTSALEQGASPAAILLGFATSAENYSKMVADGWLFMT